MANVNEQSYYKEFDAELVRIYVREKLSDYPAISESMQLEVFRFAVDSMVVQIVAWMTGGKIPSDTTTKDFRYPDGAWQTFKERHLPHWFKRWFPVRWHEETVTVQTNHYFVCPHLVTDKQGQHVRFMATGNPLATYFGREQW